MSKDLRALVEAAQAAVLREINARSSFLRKLVGADKQNNLKEIQSNLAKLLKQLDRNNSGDLELISKLQTQLNEKSNLIRSLEKNLEESKDEASLAKSKSTAYVAELEELRKQQQQRTEVPQITANPVADEASLKKAQELCEELKARNQKLEQRNNELNQEMKDAWELSLEFNKRLKKLKSEILAP